MFDVLFRDIGGWAGVPLKLLRRPYDGSYTDADGKRHGNVHHGIILDVPVSLEHVRRLQIGGATGVEVAQLPEECDPAQYPASYRQAVDAEVLALPPWQEIIEPSLLDAIPEDLRSQIQTGFDITNCPEDKQAELLERYHGQPEQLLAYLSALVDRHEAKPAPQVPRSKPQADQLAKPKPAPRPAPEPAPKKATGGGFW